MKIINLNIKTDASADYARASLYLLDTVTEKIKIRKRPVVVICPGGGYERTSFREGEPVAIHFLNQGYHAVVLDYSCAPVKYPTALLELANVMKELHAHAEEWAIDPESIILHGASAGGHLAGCMAVLWNQDWLAEMAATSKEVLKAKGVFLSYPVVNAKTDECHMDSFINLLQTEDTKQWEKLYLDDLVTSDTPPTFIWATTTDMTVPVENSLDLYMALKKAGVPAELHLFSGGPHGLSLASELVRRPDDSGVDKEASQWIYLTDSWLHRLFHYEK